MVSHLVLLDRLDDIVVMSGEVGCWFRFGGTRVCELVLSIVWSEAWMMVAMWSPLWSVIGECHSFEWAFRSPVISEFGVFVR